MTLAIGLHNIPEGLAVATVLVARGVSPRKVCLLSHLFRSLCPNPDMIKQKAMHYLRQKICTTLRSIEFTRKSQ